MNAPHPRVRSVQVLITCFAAQIFCIGSVTNLVGLMVGPISHDLKLSRLSILLASASVLYLSWAMLSLVIGLTQNLFSQRIKMIVGVLCVGAGFLGLAMATSLVQIGLIFGVPFGIGLANIQLATTGLVVESFARWRGQALGILAMGVSTAGVLLAPTFVYISRFHGWRGTAAFLACTAFAMLVPILLFARSPSARSPSARSPAVRSAPNTPAMADDAAAGRLADHLKKPAFWAITLANSLVTLGTMGALYNMTTITEPGRYGPAQVALLFSCTSFSAIMGKIIFTGVCGFLTQRQIVAAAMALLILGCALFSQPGHYAALVAGTIGLGAALGISIPALPLLLGAHYPGRSFMPALGACTMFCTLQMVIGPPLTAWAGAALARFDVLYAGAAMVFPVFAVVLISLLPKATYLTNANAPDIGKRRTANGVAQGLVP